MLRLGEEKQNLGNPEQHQYYINVYILPYIQQQCDIRMSSRRLELYCTVLKHKSQGKNDFWASELAVTRMFKWFEPLEMK